MRLSRANIPLASEDRTHSQAISPSPHYNLAPHFWPGFINLQHFCHSRWRNPVRLSKSGLARSAHWPRSSFRVSQNLPFSSQFRVLFPVGTFVSERPPDSSERAQFG